MRASTWLEGLDRTRAGQALTGFWGPVFKSGIDGFLEKNRRFLEKSSSFSGIAPKWVCRGDLIGLLVDLSGVDQRIWLFA